MDWITILFALASAVLLFRWRVNAAWLVVVGAVVGLLATVTTAWRLTLSTRADDAGGCWTPTHVILPDMLRRAFALSCATWLAIMIAEPTALHVCEMHGGAGHSAAADESTTDHPHGAHDAAPSGHENAHTCTCLGECCAVALAPVPAADVAMFAPASVRRDVAFPAARVVAREVAGLILPFATAPPVLPTIPLISLG